MYARVTEGNPIPSGKVVRSLTDAEVYTYVEALKCRKVVTRGVARIWMRGVPSHAPFC